MPTRSRRSFSPRLVAAPGYAAPQHAAGRRKRPDHALLRLPTTRSGPHHLAGAWLGIGGARLRRHGGHRPKVRLRERHNRWAPGSSGAHAHNGRTSTRAAEEFVTRAWISSYRASLTGLWGAERPAPSATATQNDQSASRSTGGGRGRGPRLPGGLPGARRPNNHSDCRSLGRPTRRWVGPACPINPVCALRAVRALGVPDIP